MAARVFRETTAKLFLTFFYVWCQPQQWPVALPMYVVVSFSPSLIQWSGALRYLLNEKQQKERDKDQISYEILGKWERKKKLERRNRRISFS
jgi:hypothetical protein